jgi:hypothetical protein
MTTFTLLFLLILFAGSVTTATAGYTDNQQAQVVCRASVVSRAL